MPFSRISLVTAHPTPQPDCGRGPQDGIPHPHPKLLRHEAWPKRQKAIVPGTMAPVTGAVSVDIAFFLPGCGILPTASASSQNHVRYTPRPAFRHAVRGPRLTEAGHERQRTSPRNTGDPARATEARSRENSIRSHSLAKLAATSVLPRARDLRRQIAPMNEAAAKSGPGRVCGEQETIRVGLQGP